MIYFAYGSNMASVLMTKRCPGAKLIGCGVIKHYQLVYKGAIDRAYATIEPATNKEVPVVIWDITPSDEDHLDAYEDYPSFYDKLELTAHTTEQTYQGMVYVMNAIYPYNLPKSGYIETIALGYQEFNFDLAMLDEVMQFTQQKIQCS